MLDLAASGQLTRKKSKGTFVAAPKIEARFFARLQSFHEEMNQKGFEPSTQVLNLEIVKKKANIAEKLHLPLKSEFIMLERLRFADSEPVVYLQTFIPHTGYEILMNIDFTINSLYEVMEQKCHVRVHRVVREIEAVNTTRREAELLGLSHLSAICLVKTTAYTENDIPVEYSIARYRGDRNKFIIGLMR